MAWKVNLYRGYIAICHPDEHHLNMVTMVTLSSSRHGLWTHRPSIRNIFMF
ncbi:hypothetical protein DPMN_149497 [Dreissena polymorpha]|uniref:Uncharacterized protein n=1 Tax=Dreissena polymorpha TaxID=45954 RepID=A0A9D4J2H2_DREPO|nr:hypothetical protein DPMN_149497 [Dreissena polymorpha]